MKICFCALSSETLDLISRMFSSVSCIEACSAPSASCILLWRFFIGLRNATTRARPNTPPQISKITKCQSIAIRIAEAPTKLTTMPIRLGRIFMMPFLITDMSENTRFTSSPLWYPLSLGYSLARISFTSILCRDCCRSAEACTLSHARAADSRCCARIIPTRIRPYLVSSLDWEETALSTRPFVASVNPSEHTVATTVSRQTRITLM